MTERTPHRDNWEKLDKEFGLASEETERLYMLWSRSCERLKRLGRLRNDAFKELVASDVAAHGECENKRLRAALQWIADQVDNEDGDLDDIILCANKALAHEQREDTK